LQFTLCPCNVDVLRQGRQMGGHYQRLTTNMLC
jgi:hypothetical protein